VLIAIAIVLAALAAGVAASDVTDNTQSAGDAMTSLLLWCHTDRMTDTHRVNT